MTDYAELRAALEAGPTPGPWSGRTGGLDAGLATDCAIHTWERCIAQITDNPLNQRDMAYIAAAHPEVIRALLAERDALREALEWNAGALMAACKAGRVSELDRLSSDTETYTVGVILDMAESALAQDQEET